MNVLYQLIGFGALITMGLSYWQKDKRMILLWQVVADFGKGPYPALRLTRITDWAASNDRSFFCRKLKNWCID